MSAVIEGGNAPFIILHIADHKKAPKNEEPYEKFIK